MADAAVSVLVIVGLLLGALFGWILMDPLAGIVGALVIAGWAIRCPRYRRHPAGYEPRSQHGGAHARHDRDRWRSIDRLHLWRLGPGHLGAILAVATRRQRGPKYYRALFGRFRSLSHVTVQVQQQ